MRTVTCAPGSETAFTRFLDHDGHLDAEVTRIELSDRDEIAALRRRDRRVLAARCFDESRALERTQQIEHVLLLPAAQAAALVELVEAAVVVRRDRDRRDLRATEAAVPRADEPQQRAHVGLHAARLLRRRGLARPAEALR